MFGTGSGRGVGRWRRRRNGHSIRILTYHCVSGEETPLTRGTRLRLHPADFEQQIDTLVARYCVISLEELVGRLERRDPPHRAAVITFDDGYAATIRQALPILYRRRLPATVFPVTSVIGNGDLLWQHKLSWLMDKGHEGKVEDAVRAEGYPPRMAGEPFADFARRCYRVDLPDLLEDVLRRTGNRGTRLAATLRPYPEPEDVAEADPSMVAFGNHTHTHPVLSALSAEEQRREMATARDALASLTGAPPIALALPFGLEHDCNADSTRVARETGHRAVLDMQGRINTGSVDPFVLSGEAAPSGDGAILRQGVEDWPVGTPVVSVGGGP